MKLFKLFKKEKVDNTATPIIQPATKPKSNISVLMPNGTIEEYPPTFIITDRRHCIVCNSNRYHTSFDCKYFIDEMKSGKQVIGLKLSQAYQKHYYYCENCETEFKDYMNDYKDWEEEIW